MLCMLRQKMFLSCLFVVLFFVMSKAAAALGTISHPEKNSAPDSSNPVLISLLQNLRPFSTIRLEYSEEEAGEDAKVFSFLCNKMLLLDFRNGNYKEIVVKPTKGRKSFLYCDRSWNGSEVVSISCLTGSGSIAEAENEMRVQKKATTAIISSSDMRLHFASDIVLRIYKGFPLCSLYEQLASNEQIEISSTFKGCLRIVAGGALFINVDVAEGTVLDVAFKCMDRKGVEFDLYKIEISKYAEVDGWKFPIELLFTQRNSNGEFVTKRKISVRRDSIVLNKNFQKSDFVTRIPIGAFVENKIENITYRAAEIDLMAKREIICKDLEKMISEIKKSSK